MTTASHSHRGYNHHTLECDQITKPESRSSESRSVLTITVVVPTWQRPDYFVRCLESLCSQTRPPDQVLAVMRRDDAPTHAAFQSFLAADASRRGNFFAVEVDTPGFLPPVLAGIANATSDIVAFLDDDAEALPDWLKRIESHYADPRVGGVGGRYVNIYDGREVFYPSVKVVGKFYWFGRTTGHMYRELVPEIPRDVDYFMGGNMSYRRSILSRVSLDLGLNENVAFNYELDLGLQVKELGYVLRYDPAAKIRHYSAPRPTVGMRGRTPESVYWYSHNLLYITLKHVRGPRRWLAVAYSFLVGDRMGWGLASAAFDMVRNRSMSFRREIGPAFAGKWAALRHWRGKR